ncbi:hypothetical protein [Aminipila luticellarii]|uniref:Uncharacterized protein n=1 Tax=Aminipila luticellarii TaxID=2507160 RepID=A0A410PUH5_9FIRM|nr:hypothetical protein [Aminipila luticellarii]QAT42575.1 hypothetical protein EQM06_04700 [Aminipila luticellarii]
MKKSIIISIVTILVLVFGISMAMAATDQPGSESDPVVTKSYVDSRTSYSPISLTAGQKLIGGEGTEIILRSGEATAIDNGANGVSDLTAGTDLTTGSQVAVNHLLLVPRNDDRGITATTDIWVMIRGTYTIQ